MDKKEYVSPEMEIVEITEQGSLLQMGSEWNDSEHGRDEDPD